MKPLDLQRKSPKQGRSKGLVDAIFEATVRILPNTGSRNITTRKIAEIAGVSIGSLYQYFPNKESVLASLMDITIKTVNGRIQKMIDELEGQPLENAVDRIVDFGVEQLMSERAKIREIFFQAPELGRMPALYHQRQIIVIRLAGMIAKQRPGYSREKYVRTVFMAINACVGVIQTILYDETQTYDNETISIELKSLAKSYLNQELPIVSGEPS